MASKITKTDIHFDGYRHCVYFYTEKFGWEFAGAFNDIGDAYRKVEEIWDAVP